MKDLISQIFNEVIAIFNINEKDADERGLWKEFEKSLKQLISQQDRQVDKEYIEEKAGEWATCGIETREELKDFIRFIVKEIQGNQKPRVTKEFVEKWWKEKEFHGGCSREAFREMLIEAGLKVEE